MAEPIKDDFELYESGIDAFCFLKECYSVPRDSDNPTVGTCVIPDERLQQLILDKQKEYIDSGKKYTVILHTTHMSIPPTEYLKSPESKPSFSNSNAFGSNGCNFSINSISTLFGFLPLNPFTPLIIFVFVSMV